VMDSGMAYAASMDSNYDSAYGTATLTITRATATVSIVDYNGVYDANSHTASVTITGLSGVELASDSVTGINVMDSGRTAWAYTMDSNYLYADGTATLTITPAKATVSIVDYNGVYDANSHTASVTITGVGGVEIASGSVTGTNVMDSGMAYAASMDSNYDSAYGTATLTITKATLTVDVTGYTGGAYDSTEKTQSVSVTGVGSDGQLFADSLTGTNVGSYSRDWSYSNPNYHDVSGRLAFTITVPDNQTPTDLTLSATSIAENQASGTAVGSFSTTDADVGNTFTYTLVSGTGSADNGSFTIDGSTLKTAASFDYETKNSYSIRVRTTDQGGLSYDKQFTITVLDVNEAATQITLSNVVSVLLATANTSSAIPLADVSVTDDGLGTNTVSVGGADANVFEVVAGQLRLKAGTVLNYATQKTYSVTVDVDDTTVGSTPDASVNYTLTLQGFDGITVQNGAVGRSYVQYVSLTFGTALGLAEAVASVGTATPRIRLLWGGAGGKVWSQRTLTSSMVSVSGSQLLFDFGPQGIGGTANSAIGDGLYRLRVDLDGSVDSAGKRLSEVVANFFRLFGDVDGNGEVNDTDISLVTAAQGTTGLNLATDLNGDGFVNATDLTNVKRRKGARVTL